MMKQTSKLLVALAVVLSLGFSACCKPGQAGAKCRIQEALKTCGGAWFEGKLPGLMQSVSKILEGGGPNWQGQLKDLAVDGIGVVACAVKKYVELNSAATKPTEKEGVSTKSSALTVKKNKLEAMQRALKFLQEHDKAK